ncbi:YycH family regulatory protein [Sporolactobacillus vineae]|uniref:YycH family regulatory protein n=1 Tax=Sporolactobacillus vineae TaxID=444463 RepID=UPI000287F294|nr:two-component system activity regulator YycH [Sporolactobacillus vineae]
MNREFFKSLLLGVLVVASIAMTWNIWFYKMDYKNYKGPSNSANSVAIAGSYKMNEVIRPTLVIAHAQNGTSGETASAQIREMYQAFQRVSFTNIVPSSKKSLSRKSGTVSYEIVFPSPLIQGTLNKLFHFHSGNGQIPQSAQIDRIEIYQAAGTGTLMASFRSGANQEQFSAKVSGTSLSRLSANYSEDRSSPYRLQRLKNYTAYLPAGYTKIRSQLMYFQKTPINAFIPILFTDPKNVFHDRGKTAFNDGTSQLEATNNIMQYVNTGITNNSSGLSDPIIHSYEFIDNFKAWTNNFIYDGYSDASDQQKTVTFRMMFGDYMVFNTEYYPNPFLTTMELTWENQDLTSFNRTLLTFSRIDATNAVVLDPGNMVLQKLRQASVPVNQIEDMVIGYKVANPMSGNNTSLMASPDWFYKINGKWYSETSALLSRQPNSQRENLQ